MKQSQIPCLHEPTVGGKSSIPMGTTNSGRRVRVRQLADTRKEAGDIIPGILPFRFPTCWRFAEKGAIPRPYKLSVGLTILNLDAIEASLATKRNRQ